MEVKSIIFFFSSLFIFSCSLSKINNKEKPNIVFISIDDLNDWVGFLGYDDVFTSNMDRLAENGFSFYNAHCPAPICGPSRTAILTGMRPVTSGVYDNNIKFSKDLPNVVTLTEHFRKNGYQVYGVGKLFHGGVSNVPREAFDEYGGRIGSAAPFSSSDLQNSKQNPSHEVTILGKKFRLPLNGMPADRYWNKAHTFDWGPLDLPDSLFSDRMSVDWAIDRLEKIKDQPFLLTLGFERPHQPLFNPMRFHEMYPLDKVNLPVVPNDDFEDLPHRAKQLALYPKTSGRHETVVKYNQWENAVASYLASVSFVDELIGDMLKALEKNDLMKNTWIVLWSDHGWHLGEKRHWGKATGWFRSTRVPFLIVPPEGNPEYNSSVKIYNMVNLLDLAPTMADMAGIPKKKSWEGRSLIPLLKGQIDEWEEVSLTTFSIGSHTVSTPDWQLISYFDGSFELYDMKNDINQFKNVIDQPENSNLIEQLKKYIPKESKWKYFIRYMNYKILVPNDGAIQVYNQMLEGKNDKDIAQDLPELVEKVKSYLKKYKPDQKKFSIESL